MKRVNSRRIAPLLVAPAMVLLGATASAETREETALRLALAGKAVPTVALGCANRSHKYRCDGIAAADEAGGIRRTPHAGGGAPGTNSFEGYVPSDLASAYGLTAATASGGTGKTVAIIDAFTFPTALSDVNEYRKEAGFAAYNSAGGPTFAEYPATGTTLPGEDPDDTSPQGGWGDETMLDLEMVSAACPACNVIIIEPSGSGDNEGFNAAPGVAASKGAVAISNSYGSDEDSSVIDDPTFNLGVLITASAGDSGYGASYPATSPYVVAVGGTDLVPDTTGGPRGWNEYLWAYSPPSKANGEQASGTGSGCSRYIATPSFQSGLLPSGITSLCSERMEVDVAGDADPYTGVQVILTISGQLDEGVVGGTSASSPFVAAMMVRFGLETQGNSFVYGSVSNGATTMFNDITTVTPDTAAGETANTNAASAQDCGLMCMAATGYDGPTGWGSPNGAAWSDAPSGDGGGSGVVDAGSPAVDAGFGALEDAGPAIATGDGGVAFPASGASSAGCGCSAVGLSDRSPPDAGGILVLFGLATAFGLRSRRARRALKAEAFSD